MEALFILASIVIALINYAAKKQEEQNKQQGGAQKRQPVHRTSPLRKAEGSIQEIRSKVEKSLTHMDSEGLEAEDRSRFGSLDYVELSQSQEGICDEHPFHMEEKVKEPKQPVPMNDIAAPLELEGSEEGIEIVLTEEHLLSSFVMSEIIGPPRALKRSIR